MSDSRDPRSHSFAIEFLSWLVNEAIIAEAAASRGLVTQRETGERVDRVLTELGLLGTEDLVRALGRYLALDLHDAALDLVDQEAIEQLTHDFARRARLVPVRRQGSLSLISSDPFNADAINAAQFELGASCPLIIASDSAVARLLEVVSKHNRAASPESAVQASASDVRRLKESASEAPIIRAAQRIIGDAVRARASDIHFDAFQNGLSVRFRLDGILVERERFQAEVAPAIVSRLKIMAGLNIAENRLPQDGRILTVVDGRDAEFRMATTPVVHGESVVLRLLGRSSVDADLSALGLDAETRAFLQQAVLAAHGLLLITGPTGSGKTTTLYATLKELNNGQRKIISIEDPVEIAIDGITQIPVRSALGLGFADALRTVLRHDPDVVMVGELRDHDTAKVGLQAALTGHMVLSTLHTNSAAASVTRLFDLGIEPFLVASTLSGVIAQRLIRCLCPRCKRPTPADAAVEALARAAGADMVRGLDVYSPGGCEHCHGTGYAGRTTLTELLVIDQRLRALVAERANENQLAAFVPGPASLAGSGWKKVMAGATSAAEVLRVTRGGA